MRNLLRHLIDTIYVVLIIYGIAILGVVSAAIYVAFEENKNYPPKVYFGVAIAVILFLIVFRLWSYLNKRYPKKTELLKP